MNARFTIGSVLALGLVGQMIHQTAAEELPGVEARFGGEISKAANPSFRRHVVPLASKLGCSGRECHGSLQGRGGFRLSLFGYDFDADHKAMTADKDDDIRVDLKNPKQSLIIVKPTKQVKHKGGERFEVDSWEYNVVQVDSKWRQE